MVKSNSVLRKNLYKSIKASLGRFVAIMSIIALGAAMFVGLRITRTDMLATGSAYMKEQNMFDLRLLSTYGWSQDNLEEISALPGVEMAEGVKSLDAIADIEGGSSESVFRFYNIPERVNLVRLQGGRMPEKPDECLADGYHYGKNILGKKITIAESNEESVRDALKYRTYTVVGYVSTPIYMNMERGNTSLASGQVTAYFYIPSEGFTMDYYTEIDITLTGEKEVYTKQYDTLLEDSSETLEPLLLPIAEKRAAQVKEDAWKAWEEGMQEYEDGIKELAEKKKEVYGELADAKKELEEGQKEIDEKKILLEEGWEQLKEAKEQIYSNRSTLSASSAEIASVKADTYEKIAQANSELLVQYKTILGQLREVESGINQIDNGLRTVDSYINGLNLVIMAGEMNLTQINSTISVLETGIKATESMLTYAKSMPVPDEELIAELEDKLAKMKAERDSCLEKKAEITGQIEEARGNLAALEAQKADLEAQKATLEEARDKLNDGMDQLEVGFREAQIAQAQADKEFASGDARIEAAKAQLDAAERTILAKEKELEDGQKQLDEAQEKITAGWAEYHDGMQEADTAMAEGLQKLTDARKKLADAKVEIEGMGDPEVFLLGRNTNSGYVALDNNSEIVSGVAKVFPVFFLLVAALVCITTMTRMVSEERTQIGTMKALGYTDGEIIRKYLVYSGSAAVFGCTLGVLAGSVVFPQVLWMAYGIMFNITEWVTMKLDWPLCLAVVSAYTAVSLGVTWYCCNSELKEVPSELMRPKAPTSGKKIFLEFLPFWDRIGFLNKVMLRNIFRYRQRLAMMLLGIGGCMALLMTGFGIGDSISGFVDFQFANITQYDIQILFSEGLSDEQQAEFRDAYGQCAEKMMFFSQSSITLDYGGKNKDLYLIVTDEDLRGFVDMHKGSEPVSMPGPGEAVLSIGAAEALNVKVGDTVTTVDTEMRQLTVKVSGIFDNHVHNYLIVRPETVEEQQGRVPEKQMAYLNLRQGYDAHEVSASLSEDDLVYNVLVCSTLQDVVNSMMDAMDLVVVTVVVCAGLLGAIVLYNLTNININERVREVATIKVLGFYPVETALYVFKENLALAAMGALLGTGFGRLLLGFVMDKIRIDMVWFDTVITWKSVLLSFAFTMLTAVLVDIVFYPKVEKINMAEALKSVE